MSAMPETTSSRPLGGSDWPVLERRPVMPAGFAAGATRAGIKPSGRPDLAIIRTTGGPAAAAAVFTTNAFPAAPVLLSRANLAASRVSGLEGATTLASAEDVEVLDPAEGAFGWADAIVSTSGSANAATGLAGLGDQVAISQAVAERLSVDALHVLCLSTGVIGVRLPVERVVAAIDDLATTGLATIDPNLEAVAVALRTTDTTTTVATATVELPASDGSRRHVRVSGIAKGVGMIHPNMATMLAVILTDALVAPRTLSHLLRPTAARTWNQLTVDGDTSTNDTVFVLASGASGTTVVRDGSSEAATLGTAIEAVARDLARQQAADGEGATTLIECGVEGAEDDADARAIARAVVASPLVKTAIHGHDPNWGRILAAAGNARLPTVELLEMAGLGHEAACARAGGSPRIDPDLLRISVAGTVVFDGAAGGPVAFDRDAVRASMMAPEVPVRLELKLGEGRGEAFGCDLSQQYVIENSEYTT